jgi:hypothetical protein
MTRRRRFLLLPILLVCLGGTALAVEREAREPSEADAVDACLKTWGEHPFQGAERQRFRVLSSSVKVFGIGGDVADEHTTLEPQLVLVKPAVNVLGKARFRLMNPNGWYCFESAVTVLAKSEIIVACGAHLASSADGVAVAGGNVGADGVTVLGKAVVKRVGCEAAPPAPVE